jgi:hypothetical protein
MVSGGRWRLRGGSQASGGWFDGLFADREKSSGATVTSASHEE